MTEATFILDSFRNNIVLSGEKAYLRQIYNLMLMKKGTDPLNPDKGCDILNSTLYHATDSISILNLEQIIKNQIDTYTNYRINTVKCNITEIGGEYYLYILISISPMGETYAVISNGKRSTITQMENPSSTLGNAIKNK